MSRAPKLAILASLDLTTVSLLMLEYHDLERRRAIEQHAADSFVVERATAFPWAQYLQDGRYRQRSRQDEHGVLVLANRRLQRMQRLTRCGFRLMVPQACAPLPRLAVAAARRRGASLRRRPQRASR